MAEPLLAAGCEALLLLLLLLASQMDVLHLPVQILEQAAD
jgi:hypothetical protein